MSSNNKNNGDDDDAQLTGRSISSDGSMKALDEQQQQQPPAPAQQQETNQRSKKAVSIQTPRNTGSENTNQVRNEPFTANNNQSQQQQQQPVPPAAKLNQEKKHAHSRTFSAGGVGGILGASGALPPPASLSRAPRIILQEKEKREKAAQELLGQMSGGGAETISSRNVSHQNLDQLMGDNPTSSPQPLNNNNQIGAFPSVLSASVNLDNQNTNNGNHHSGDGSPHQDVSSASQQPKQFAIEFDEHKRQATTLLTKSGKTNLQQGGLFSQTAQQFEEAEPMKEGKSPTTTNSNNNNNNNMSAFNSNMMMMNANSTTNNDQESFSTIPQGESPQSSTAPANTSLSKQQQQQQQHARVASNIEFFIRTEHGGHNRASVKFDSQQESMAVFHHHHVNNNTTATVPRHGRSTSGQTDANFKLPQTTTSSTTDQQQQQEFNETQLAAIQAFSGDENNQNQHNRSPSKQHVRAISSKFYSRPDDFGKQLAGANNNTNNNNANDDNFEFDRIPAATPTTSHQSPQVHQPSIGSGRSEQYSSLDTSNSGSHQNQNNNVANRTNPLQGMAGQTKHHDDLVPPPFVPGSSPTTNAAGPNQSQHKRTPSALTTQPDDGEGASVVFAGYGPRTTLELPKIPHDHPFKQHTLPSLRWHTPWCANMLMLVLILVTCAPIGSVIVAETEGTKRVDVRYDTVAKYSHPISYNGSSSSSSSSSLIGNASGYLWSRTINEIVHRQGVKTLVRFNVSKKLKAPVIMSYGLTKFYQNHLNVLQSKSFVQLAGSVTASDLDIANCEPLLYPGGLTSDDLSKTKLQSRSIDDSTTGNANWRTYKDFIYSPCGTLPWSMFNDSFAVFKVAAADEVADVDSYRWSSALKSSTNPTNFSTYKFFSQDSRYSFTASSIGGSSNGTLVCNSSDFGPTGNRLSLSSAQNPCEKNGIQINSDRSRNKNPDFNNNNGNLWTSTLSRQYNTTDAYLKNGWYAEEPGHSVPYVNDVDFQVWWRIAPLSTFRKVLRIIHQDMDVGQYQMEVDEYFDSTSYGGQKFLSFESRDQLVGFGGQNVAFATVHYVAAGFAMLLFLGYIIEAIMEFCAKKRETTPPSDATENSLADQEMNNK